MQAAHLMTSPGPLDVTQKQFEEVTGQPFDPPKAGSKGGKKKGEGAGSAKAAAAASSNQGDGYGGEMRETNNRDSLVITPRAQDYSQWYLDIISAADLVDQSPVKGCMVIKPYGMVGTA